MDISIYPSYNIRLTYCSLHKADQTVHVDPVTVQYEYMYHFTPNQNYEITHMGWYNNQKSAKQSKIY